MKLNQNTRIGVIGYGNFGKLLTKMLKPHANVSVYDPKESRGNRTGVKFVSFFECAKSEVIILAVPIPAIPEVLRKLSKKLSPNALVLDVASVKTYPIKWMRTILPKSVQICGTHPLFGPHTAQNGWKGLELVLCPVRINQATKATLVRFITKQLKLKIVNMTPEAHDQLMARTQVITHFIARVLNNLPFEREAVTFPTYQRLRDFQQLLAHEPWQLTASIETLNPFAKDTRKLILASVKKIEKKIRTFERNLRATTIYS